MRGVAAVGQATIADQVAVVDPLAAHADAAGQQDAATEPRVHVDVEPVVDVLDAADLARAEDQVVGRDDPVHVVEAAQLAAAAAGQPAVDRNRHAVVRVVGVGDVQVAGREQVAEPPARVAGVDRDAGNDFTLDARLQFPVVRPHVPTRHDRRIVVRRARVPRAEQRIADRPAGDLPGEPAVRRRIRQVAVDERVVACRSGCSRCASPY